MTPRSSAILAPADRDRLAAILALLASDHPGERDAAANAATRFLRTRDLSWRDVLASPSPDPPPGPGVLEDWPERWRTAVALCQRANGLSDWDRKFLAVIAAYGHRPSARQIDILRTICDRVLAGGSP